MIALTLAGLAWLGWLLFSVYFSGRAKAAEQAEAELVWDEGLREGTAPPPMWWFWLLLTMMVFSSAYLLLYPGLGNMRGGAGMDSGGSVAGQRDGGRGATRGFAGEMARGGLG